MGLLKKKSRSVLEGKLAVFQESNNAELLGNDTHSSEEVEKNLTRGSVPRPLMNVQVVVESIILKVPYLGAI